MKYTIKLEQKDIIDIIHRHFGCIDPENIQLEIKTTAEDPKTGFIKAGLNVGACIEFEKDAYEEIPF